LLYATLLNALAGAVTGSVFKVRVLWLLLAIIVVESVILAFVQGSIAGLWAIANVIGIDGGYLAGIFARSLLERVERSRASA
jgi:hypothetical protein